VKYGTLIAELARVGDVVNAPPNHVVCFIGDMPCDSTGKELDGLRNPEGPKSVDTDLRSDRTFSARPANAYTNYYDKMVTCVAMLSAQAKVIDPNCTATPFLPLALTEEQSVFHYADTASSRAGISAISGKLEGQRIAIVGTGGTGSYVLDLTAKTPVAEIHLYDGDVFSSHNAFRSPGAASLEELEKRPSKVAYLRSIYSKLRRGIVAHEYMLDKDNVKELAGMSFVFLCMDGGDDKKAIVGYLREAGIPFADTGLGIQNVDDKLTGVVRTTSCTPAKSDHVADDRQFDGGGQNEYDRNIQVAELNAMNAAFAVIKWKKLLGFYADEKREHSTHYSISKNTVLNEHAA